MSSPFRTEKQDHVATLWLDAPDRRNAMGKAFWAELPGVVAELDRDDDVRAVVVAAKGKHFSVGLDLVEMGSELGPMMAGGLAKERRRLFDVIHQMRAGFDAMVASRKPFVASVHGACIGGGLDLLAACDVRVCSADAKFSLRETKIAIVADMGSLQRLRGVVGEGHLRELALTGKDIDADRALRIGLVNDVYPTEEACRASAVALAREIAQNSPIAVMGTKEVLNVGAQFGSEAALRYVAAWNASQLASGDLAEAMGAFMARRPAVFKGE